MILPTVKDAQNAELTTDASSCDRCTSSTEKVKIQLPMDASADVASRTT